MSIEIIELKSWGHPDTITDTLVEKCADVVEEYMKEKKIHIHYNLDKALFSSGTMNIGFDYCDEISTPTFILGGNIGHDGSELDYLLYKTISDYMFNNFNGMYVKIDLKCLSSNSQGLESMDKESVVAGDTSYAVAKYPLSISEAYVLDINMAIREYSKIFPIGYDYKIMFRNIDGLFKANISIPVFHYAVKNIDEYAGVINGLHRYLSERYQGAIWFEINSDMQFGNYWLTRYGSSIENGDCGQVGRGNRLNGLITPMSAMTLEAYHGKNRTNHTGRILQQEALVKAKELSESYGGKTVEVYLVSKIGKPITDYEIYHKIID